MNFDRLRSISWVAEFTDSSTWTVRGWIKRGLLKRYKVGGRVLIAEDDLHDFITQSTSAAEARRNKGTA